MFGSKKNKDYDEILRRYFPRSEKDEMIAAEHNCGPSRLLGVAASEVRARTALASKRRNKPGSEGIKPVNQRSSFSECGLE